MTARRTHILILFVHGFLTSAVLTLSLSGCGKGAVPGKGAVAGAGAAPAAVSVGKPLTEEECLATAKAISQAVASGDMAALDRLIDWDAVNERSTGGIDTPERFRKDFIKGMADGQKGTNGLMGVIVRAVKDGGSYKLLHSHTEGKRHWLLFRLLHPDSGLNYHDFLLARRPDGKVRAVDMYVYLSGEPISQIFRRVYVQAVSQGGVGLVGRLTGADQKYVKHFKNLKDMNAANKSGQFAEVLKIYKSSPPEFRKEKTVMIVRLQAAQKLGDDGEYVQSIEDFRKEYPNDACVNILSIDYYLLKKRYRECLDCIDRLDRAVHVDPYLQTLRANVHSEQNDLVAARADLKKALDGDPEMVDAYWTLVGFSLKENNYEETLKTLRLIRDKFRMEIGDLTKVEPYKGFTESPQYQEWLKDKPGAGKDAGAKGPAAKLKR